MVRTRGARGAIVNADTARRALDPYGSQRPEVPCWAKLGARVGEGHGQKRV